MQEIDVFYPKSRKEWRNWLKKNHKTSESVWLIYYKKKSNMPSLSWGDAVEEALCFGWIDSKAKPIDEDKYMQFFTKRKPKSVWSKINKEKVRTLIEAGHMTEAGMAVIEIAKQNGSWTILDEVEELTIPEDLEKAFKKHKGSKEYFHSLSKSVKKMILHWLVTAKRTETREKRITEIVIQASQKLKPKQF